MILRKFRIVKRAWYFIRDSPFGGKPFFNKRAVKKIRSRAGLDTGKSRRKPSGTTRAWFLEKISRRANTASERIFHAGKIRLFSD